MPQMVQSVNNPDLEEEDGEAGGQTGGVPISYDFAHARLPAEGKSPPAMTSWSTCPMSSLSGGKFAGFSASAAAISS